MAGAKGSPCPPTGTTCELCPPGWQLHRGKCYFFSEEARSWEDSQKNCLARKSQLLVIEDEIEMVSLAAQVQVCHRPQANISPRENGLDVKRTHRQARAPSGRASDSPCTGAGFGNVSRVRLKRRSPRDAKCGSQSSFEWEEEMLGTFHPFPAHGSGKRGAWSCVWADVRGCSAMAASLSLLSMRE